MCTFVLISSIHLFLFHRRCSLYFRMHNMLFIYGRHLCQAFAAKIYHCVITVKTCSSSSFSSLSKFTGKPTETSKFLSIDRFLITYILGRQNEASSLSRKHVCESFGETVNALHNSEWTHLDLFNKHTTNSIKTP